MRHNKSIKRFNLSDCCDFLVNLNIEINIFIKKPEEYE